MLRSIANDTYRCLHTSRGAQHIMKMTRVRVVDNSQLGQEAELANKPARCIQVYHKRGWGTLGDKILVTIRGQMKKAYIVGCKEKTPTPMVPRFDTNNVVLLDDKGEPLGTRIKVPVPTKLRGRTGEFSKIIAIASRFV